MNTHRLLVSGHRVDIPEPAPDVRDRIILVQCSQIKELTQQLSELQKRLADLIYEVNAQDAGALPTDDSDSL